jgi:hypothetical protein
MPISVQFSRVQLIRGKDSSLLLFYISIITYVPFPPVLINWWLFSLGLVWCLVSFRLLLTQPSPSLLVQYPVAQGCALFWFALHREGVSVVDYCFDVDGFMTDPPSWQYRRFSMIV